MADFSEKWGTDVKTAIKLALDNINYHRRGRCYCFRRTFKRLFRNRLKYHPRKGGKKEISGAGRSREKRRA